MRPALRAAALAAPFLPAIAAAAPSEDWSARLAADVAEVPTVLIARTDADAARLITSDVDERDRPFLTGERTPEGFHRITGGVAMAIARAKAYAPYADVLWCETSTPDLKEAKEFAEGVYGVGQLETELLVDEILVVGEVDVIGLDPGQILGHHVRQARPVGLAT